MQAGLDRHRCEATCVLQGRLAWRGGIRRISAQMGCADFMEVLMITKCCTVCMRFMIDIRKVEQC